MAGHEYKSKDKIVQKMTRDGLTEVNLHDGKSENGKEVTERGRT